MEHVLGDSSAQGKQVEARSCTSFELDSVIVNIFKAIQLDELCLLHLVPRTEGWMFSIFVQTHRHSNTQTARIKIRTPKPSDATATKLWIYFGGVEVCIRWITLILRVPVTWYNHVIALQLVLCMTSSGRDTNSQTTPPEVLYSSISRGFCLPPWTARGKEKRIEKAFPTWLDFHRCHSAPSVHKSK